MRIHLTFYGWRIDSFLLGNISRHPNYRPRHSNRPLWSAYVQKAQQPWTQMTTMTKFILIAHVIFCSSDVSIHHHVLNVAHLKSATFSSTSLPISSWCTVSHEHLSVFIEYLTGHSFLLSYAWSRQLSSAATIDLNHPYPPHYRKLSTLRWAQ